MFSKPAIYGADVYESASGCSMFANDETADVAGAWHQGRSYCATAKTAMERPAMDIDTDRIDDAVLALLYLGLHDRNRA